MKTIRDIAALREELDACRQDGERVALVPTMGNLHKGHVSLAQLAREHADRVVTTIFVNPTQFGPGEDYDRYPRTLDNDRRRLARAGVDFLFAPDAAAIYPFGQERATRVSVPGLSAKLCGRNRPGHFEGVTTVVARLLLIATPDVAVFGSKDYQQLLILKRMVSDLHFRVRIVAGATVREKDGLAMSSRNQYLDAGERARAPALYRALSDCRAALLAPGKPDFTALQGVGIDALRKAGFEPEYFEIRAADTLEAPAADEARMVVLAAAKLGGARLIDNVEVQRGAVPGALPPGASPLVG